MIKSPPDERVIEWKIHFDHRRGGLERYLRWHVPMQAQMWLSIIGIQMLHYITDEIIHLDGGRHLF